MLGIYKDNMTHIAEDRSQLLALFFATATQHVFLRRHWLDQFQLLFRTNANLNKPIQIVCLRDGPKSLRH